MSVTATTSDDVGELFDRHRRFLWGLCYRLTGCAADADDLVQETFLRALERAPARTDQPLRAWLVRVAVNLGRDLLRKRRRRGYPGCWLPSPVGTEEEPPSFEPASGPEGDPAARYDLVESVSFAFLLALEVLTPGQRAVLILRDVFDYTVRETANALGMSEANVKTTHLRARRAMAGYDGRRGRFEQTIKEKTRRALEALLRGLATADVQALEALLAKDVQAVGDAGGEFVGARVEVRGRDKVMRFYLGLAKRLGAAIRTQLRTLNGLPAVVAEVDGAPPGWAPRFVLMVGLDEEGRIRELQSVLASRKLTAVAAVSGTGAGDALRPL